MTKEDVRRVKELDNKLQDALKTVQESRVELEDIFGCFFYELEYNAEKHCVRYNVEGVDNDFGGSIISFDGVEELLADEEVEQC